MARKRCGRTSTTKRSIESYEHRDKERVNNPPVGLVTPETDPDSGQQKKYAYDPHLDPVLSFDGGKLRDELAAVIERGLAACTLEDAKAALKTLRNAQEPYLNWAGKAEHTSFEVPVVSLHVHERIDPRTIIEAVRKRNGEAIRQVSLFEQEEKPLRQAIEFYQHKQGWTNRLMAGDSLLVMNSLLEKEGMGGKVQMIYMDPPYGIDYKSNFQPFVNKRNVKDGRDEDLTAEPEQIRAFRDTWELGIHSYLTYLRDRLLLARELLHESGSIFVQIGDENVHLVRCLMDEVFGRENFVCMISFATSTGSPSGALPRVTDYLLWYAKNASKIKYRQLYGDQEEAFTPSGTDHRGEFELASMTSQDPSETRSGPVVFNGMKFVPPDERHWSFDPAKFMKLVASGRVVQVSSRQIRWKKYKDERVRDRLINRWDDTQFGGFASDKVYVVQTHRKVIERCLLMTTDPGDLVLDPTCGSGTTAYVAEKWGRRWITCDTSRVAITIARQRLMTAVFDYYELAYPEEGVGSGFKYRTATQVTLKSITDNPEIDAIYERMHPAIERALAELNAALRAHPPLPYNVIQGGRAGKQVDFRRPLDETVELPSGEQVPVGALLEWEVPSEFPADWPEAARKPFEAFHAARRTMQEEMDAAIARHASQETLYDQPLIDRKKVRVTGPFTVEAVPAPVVKSVEELLEGTPQAADGSIARSGETLRQAEWRDELLRNGIRGKNGQYIRFTRLEPLPGCRWLHASGETRPSAEGADFVHEDAPAWKPMRVVVSFGAEYGPLEPRQVAQAIEEAQSLVPKPQLIVFAAFQFDPEAAKDIDETNWPGVTLLKVQMNADLLTEDLKKKRARNESFWLIGQPDIQLERIEEGPDKGKYRVLVHGFDYYNTKTGQIESGSADKIAVWMLDTDYDGRSLYPRQVFFPIAGEKDGWAKLAKTLKAEIDIDLIEAYHGTVSLPFTPDKYRRIAVKIVDDRGIESLKVLGVD